MTIEIGADLMADKNPQFEHYARETETALKQFRVNPEKVDTQIELFSLLQVTGLLYREIYRKFGSSYGGSANKIRTSANKTIQYLPPRKNSSSLLQSIRYYLTLLSKEPPQNKTNTRSNSRLERATS